MLSSIAGIRLDSASSTEEIETMARQTATMQRPHCDDCDTNLLTHAAWLTTADGAELCISCGEARERAEAAANLPRRPAWIDEQIKSMRADAELETEQPPAPRPDPETMALLARVDMLLEQYREKERKQS
jgi:uncharacterized Zn finger protein (UPF0148 family)